MAKFSLFKEMTLGSVKNNELLGLKMELISMIWGYGIGNLAYLMRVVVYYIFIKPTQLLTFLTTKIKKKGLLKKKSLLCDLAFVKFSWIDHFFCLSAFCFVLFLSLGLVLGIKANLQDQYSHLNFALKMNEMKVLFVEKNHVLFT